MRVYRYRVVRELHGTVADAKPVASSEAVFRMLAPFFDGLDRECFAAVYVDGRNRPIGFEPVSIGSASASIVHPRETFKGAILANAAALIVAHNHPSGDPTPSAEDRRTTDRLRRAGELLGIPLLDHIVIGDGSYWSFADMGW